jgi:hypothetical protein
VGDIPQRIVLLLTASPVLQRITAANGSSLFSWFLHQPTVGLPNGANARTHTLCSPAQVAMICVSHVWGCLFLEAQRSLATSCFLPGIGDMKWRTAKDETAISGIGVHAWRWSHRILLRPSGLVLARREADVMPTMLAKAPVNCCRSQALAGSPSALACQYR